ncbi:MAG: DUF6157 family protein [Mycobacteriales bacterium]
MGYPNTFIAVAEDRPTTGEVPLERSSGRAVASTQYAMLAATPGRWTQEDGRFASSPQMRGRNDLRDEELERLRQERFAQPRACLPASPLPTSFGPGRRHDFQGRITLHALDSPEHVRLRSDPALNQLRARRSRRLRG